MRGRALPFVLVFLLSSAAEAQMTWQPTQPPLVTADNESWYRAGDAIEWNGEFYYPAGVAEAFNRYQMVRAGSYRGIPLYTDATLEPYSIVFVPIAGGRMQPYERPRTGMLAGSVGSRMSAFPTGSTLELGTTGSGVTTESIVRQAPAPPTFARAYDVGAAPPAAPTAAIGTSSVQATRPAVGTSGRSAAAVATTAARPQGINSVWLNWGNRRWVSAGRAIDLTGDFAKVGDYKGAPVYQRRGDATTIYVPTTPGTVAPFKPRER
jgi:hypothetical protein